MLLHSFDIQILLHIFHNSSYPLMFMIMKGTLSPGYYFYCIQGQQGYSGLHTNYEIDYWGVQPYCNHVTPLWYAKLSHEYRILPSHRLVAQIPQCSSPISHNAPFCNRNVHMCAHFYYKMEHYGIFVYCIIVFVRSVYSHPMMLKYGLLFPSSMSDKGLP